MSIQSNINQTLSLASLLIGSNTSIQAAAKKRREIANLEKRAEIENEQYQVLKRGMSMGGVTAYETGLDLEALGKRAVATREELFEVDPSLERYVGLTETRGMSKEISSLNRDYETRKAAIDKAAEEAGRSEADRIKRSRDFAKMITEGVPDLSFDPSTYTPPERR